MLERMWRKGTVLHHWWKCKLIQPLWRTLCRFLKKLGITLSYDPAIPLLGIYSEKTIIEKDICTPVFIAALFTMAWTWRQPRCPSRDEWIKKQWHIYNEILLSHKKEHIWVNSNEVDEPRAYITQHEVSQKNQYILTCLYGISEKVMAPHSSTPAWKIPGTEEPGGMQSMGSQRVGHDWATSLSLFTFMHWRRKRQPTPVFLPGESQGWGSLVGCHLWGHTESDTT